MTGHGKATMRKVKLNNSVGTLFTNIHAMMSTIKVMGRRDAKTFIAACDTAYTHAYLDDVFEAPTPFEYATLDDADVLLHLRNFAASEWGLPTTTHALLEAALTKKPER